MNRPVELEALIADKPSSIDIVDLPWLFRLASIYTQRLPDQSYRFKAHLFHEQASIAVTWVSSREDSRLIAGCLVSPRWASRQICEAGQILIQRLLPVERPSIMTNLFETVPFEWVQDRVLVNEAKVLLNTLPEYYVKLINSIFWDYKRFYRFLIGPSSLNGHHNDKHGNLRHTIEVVNNALLLAENRSMINLDVLTMAAFLHDAGKADEYKFNHQRGVFEISTRGALLGHKLSIVEWIAAAVAQHHIAIPEHQLLSLVHALTAAKGAPDWVGIREPVSPEANLLSVADRLSGHDDLFKQTMPMQPGFGRYHKHLKGRPFMLA